MVGLVGCGAADPATETPAAQPAAATNKPTPSVPESSIAPQSAPAPSAPPRAEPTLGRRHVGEGPPTITVHNTYPLAQHVFVDGRSMRTVDAGGSASFEVTPGVHTITCANSAEPTDMPSSLTEAFETGYHYRYDVRAR